MGENLHFLFKQRKKCGKFLETTERLKAIFLCWTNRPFFLFSKRTFSISLVVEASFFLICKPTFFFASLVFAFQVTSRVAVCWISFLRDSFLVSLSRARQLTTAEPKIPWTVASETTSSLSTNQNVSLKISWKILNISKCSLGNPSIIPLDCRCASFFPKLRFTLLWDNATAARKLGRLRQSGSAGKGDKWEWFGTERRERREGEREDERSENEVIWVLSKWTWLTWRFAQLSVRAPIQKIRALLLSCSAAQLTVLEASNPWRWHDHNKITTWLHLSVSCEVRKFVYQNVIWNAANWTYKNFKQVQLSIAIDFQFRCIHINMSLSSLQSSAEKGLFPSEAGPVVAVHKDVQEDVAATQLSQFTIQLTQLTSQCSVLLLQTENPGFDSLERRRMTRAVNDSRKEQGK